MAHEVYMHGFVCIHGSFDLSAGDKYTDGISSMCICALDALFKQLGCACDAPLFFGSPYSCLKSLHEFDEVSVRKGALSINPGLFPNTVLNSPSCRASIHHRISSPILNFINGAGSGFDAMEFAALCLFNGEYDRAIVCYATESCSFTREIEGELPEDLCWAMLLSVRQGERKLLLKDGSIEFTSKYGSIMCSRDTGASAFVERMKENVKR